MILTIEFDDGEEMFVEDEDLLEKSTEAIYRRFLIYGSRDFKVIDFETHYGKIALNAENVNGMRLFNEKDHVHVEE